MFCEPPPMIFPASGVGFLKDFHFIAFTYTRIHKYMFVLRQITSEGLESNTCVGDSYTVINRESHYDLFAQSFELEFQCKHQPEPSENRDGIHDLCYGFILFDDASKSWPLFSNSKYYMMTGEGHTFTNLSNKHWPGFKGANPDHEFFKKPVMFTREEAKLMHTGCFGLYEDGQFDSNDRHWFELLADIFDFTSLPEKGDTAFDHFIKTEDQCEAFSIVLSHFVKQYPNSTLTLKLVHINTEAREAFGLLPFVE